MRGVNWLGDAVMSIPALQRLREAKPRARLTLLAPEKLAGLWEGQPCFDDLLLFSPGDSLWQTARRLREQEFSAAVAFPNSLRSALELWLAGIPRRAGYARAGRTLFLTHPVPPRAGALAMRRRSVGEVRRLVARAQSLPPVPASAHHLHDYLAAGGGAGRVLPSRCRPRITHQSRRSGRNRGPPRPAGRARRPPLPGIESRREYGPAKRWPVESFIAAGIALHRATGCRWIIFGGPSDGQIAQAHFRRPRPAAPRAGGHQPGRPNHFARTGWRAQNAAACC